MVSKQKRKQRQIQKTQLAQQLSAMKNFRKVEINDETDLTKFVDQLDPNEYGKSWGISGNDELKEKMDRVVAEELARQKSEEREQRKINPDQISDTGNFEFGESTTDTESDETDTPVETGNFKFGQ
tara:strand:- start:2130 stop:2507 length:378 start_codon:yes stop_codon:yes gene_type:complete